ncbi:MAG TPA: DUF1992 domain-containing protein [Planctomycetota bacterium]|nr:DUF1992 domain-containing protein [Planctomycetota bacterium]
MKRDEHYIDRLIREAQERGEFDNLPGAGKPIPGLDKPHDELWWVKQLLEREEISLAPSTLALRKRVEQAIEAIRRASTEEQVRRLVADLNAEIARANSRAASGPPTDMAPLDPDETVRRWRARNSAH